MKNISFKGFKKVHEDEKHATMRHAAGHEIKIAKNALSPEMRGALAALPVSAETQAERQAASSMQAGASPKQQSIAYGNSAVNTPVTAMAHGGQPDPTQQHLTQGDALPNRIEKSVVAQAQHKGLADGGNVVLQQSKQNPPAAPLPKPMATGGDPGSDPKPGDPAGQTLNIDTAKLQGGSPITPQTQAMLAGMQQNQQAANQATDPNAIDYEKIAADPNNQPYGTAMAKQQMQQDANSGPQQGQYAPQSGDGTPTLGQAAQSDPWGTQAYLGQIQQANKEMEQGQQGEARAASIMGQQQAADIKKNLDVQQTQQQTYQQHISDLTGEYNNFMQDVQNQHIDPNHYLNSMGTAGKISTGIGLILGGIGGGLMHQANPALGFLQNQIDRDISAQQANLGKSENLLNANLKQFGNMRDATDMTRLMQMGIVENQLKQAGATAQGPMAQARAQQALAGWHEKMAPIMSQIAMRRTLLGAGSAGKVAPETLIRMIVPENQQNETFKQLKEAQDTSTFRDNALGAFDKLANINTIGNAAMSPLQTSRQVHAIQDPLTAALSKGTAGRFTEQDAGMLDSLWPAKGDSAQTVAMKRMQLQKLAEEKMHYPQLNQWGIDPRTFGRYHAGTGQKKFQLGQPVR